MSGIDGRRVLVTGAGGFIGAQLVGALARAGAEVRALVRYNSRNSWGALDWLDRDSIASVEVTLGDLRDIESVTAAVSGVELVLHLGAQIAIPYSYLNARDFFETNVLGSLNVAQAGLNAGVERVVHTSTSEVYGTAQTPAITERHPLEAQSPYAASKIGADQLMASYHRSFDLPVTILRPFNTYGPFQSARAVIPTIVAQALSGGPLRLGSLHPRRDLTFVGDTVAGFIAAATTAEAVGHTVQLGTGEDHSIGAVTEIVGELLGRELEVKLDEQRIRPEGSEVQRLISDPTRARDLLGWEPETSLRDGLAQTIEWIDANRERYRIDEYVR
jgi:NAD dependent epimerase/dehydratase